MRGWLIILAFTALWAVGHAGTPPKPRSALQNGELFLGGTYLELGLSALGSLGTVNNRPAGFFGTGTIRQGIGIVAAQLGFNTTVQPVDFVMPGTPEERWNVGYKIGGVATTRTNCALVNLGLPALTPLNITNLSNGTNLIGRLVGVLNNNLRVEQNISFRADDLFFRVSVNLTNVGTSQLDSVRYMRSCDPDNYIDMGGEYTTDNLILLQPPADPACAVRAQLSPTDRVKFNTLAPFVYYTTDQRARASIYGFSNPDPYASGAWDNPFPKNVSYTADVGVTMTFDVGTLKPNQSAIVTYYIGCFNTSINDSLTTLDNAEKADCTACAAGTYTVSQCNVTIGKSQVCAPCGSCPAGAYVATTCGGFSDVVCAWCTNCSTTTQYQTQICNGSANAVCIDITCTMTASGGMLPGTCALGYVGDTCSLTCANGYSLSGSPVGTCMSAGNSATGTWSGFSGFNCAAVNCPAANATDINNAWPNAVRNTCTANKALFSTCVLGCKNGYSPSGAVTGTCLGVGPGTASWQGMSITCSPVSCSSTLAPPENGGLGNCTTQLVGAICQMTCNDGYQRTSSPYGTCTAQSGASAVWSPSNLGLNTVCTAVSCAAIVPTNPSVVVGTCGNSVLLSTCSLGCQLGYVTNSTTTGTCTAGVGATASWIGQSIVCLGVNCTYTPVVYPVVAGTCTYAAPGTPCQLDCANGYVGSGIVAGNCNPGAGTATWGGMSITCTAVPCSTAVAPTNANAGTCTTGTLGSSCSLACNDGYSVNKTTPGTCTAATGPNSSWLGQSIQCAMVNCPSLTQTFPKLVGTCTTALGTHFATCSLACADGYAASGATTGTCTIGTGPSATWQGAAITCTAVSCAAIATLPANSLINDCTGPRVLGSTCSLRCQNGYVPSGSVNGTCAATSGPNAAWANYNITCSGAICPDAVAPTNANSGTCRGQAVGSTCTLMCNDGYNATGVTTGSCVAGSGPTATWIGQSITCTAVKCTPYPTASLPAHANIGTCGVNTMGQTCVLGCDPGYTDNFHLTATCSPSSGPTATWQTPFIVCIASTCSAVTGLGPHVLVNNCTDGGTLGSTCMLSCAPGYVAQYNVPGDCSPIGSTADAAWQDYDISCVPADCAAVTSLPAFATVGSCITHTLGSTCSLGCQDGYSPSGSVQGTCTTTSSSAAIWVGQNIVCTAVNCAAVTGLPSHVNSGTCTLKALLSTCTLGCDNGYASSGAVTGQCAAGSGATASWVNQAITCSPVSCAAVTSLPAHAMAGTCLNKVLLSTCALNCTDGYNATSVVTGTCSALTGPNAAWNSQSVNCVALSCAPATPPSNANVGTCGVGALGDSCAFACNNGYSASGSTSGTCVGASASASWIGQALTCTAVNCPVFNSLPANAQVGSCLNGGVLGAKCALNCSNGYAPSNAVNGTCSPTTGPNAAWTGPNITCLPVACTPVSAPSNGNIGTCGNASVGATCSLGCNDGYAPSGSTVGTCTASGGTSTWVGQAITCTMVKCAAATPPSHALVNTCVANAVHGATCNFICADGYSPSGGAAGVCTPGTGATASWVGQALTCTAVSCAAASAPLNGNIGTCNVSVLLSTCNLACNNGYSPSGAATGTCTAGSGATATWQGQALTCTMVPCAAVTGLPANTQRGTCLNGGVLGALCTLNCSNGYAPSLPSNGVCTAQSGPNSAWVGQLVTCTAVTCPAWTALPSNAAVGTCTAGGALAATCQLACANGFSASGASTATCTAGFGPTASWATPDITCTMVKCAAASPPSHALVGSCTGAASHGATCNFTCADGYGSSGVSQGVCTPGTGATASWVGQAITCSAVSCAPASAPLNGNVGTCGTNTLSSTCNLACNDGYSPSGSTTGTCTAGSGATASWQGQALTCTMVPCAAVSSLPANALKGTCLNGGALTATCALNCSNGYASSGVVTGVCTALTGPNSAWVGQNVTCTPVTCAPAAAPLNGNVGSCGTGALMGTCNLACNDGYSPSGSTSGTCTAGSGPTASWQGQALTCTMVPCAAVSSVPTNALKGTCLNGGALGALCTLNCSNGYAPSGVANGVCSAQTGPNSAWTGQLITCTAVSCAPASAPLNGNVGTCGTGSLGGTCNLACNDGYSPSGSTSGTCTAGSGATASWQGQGLTCTMVPCAAVSSVPTNALKGTCLNGGSLGALCTLNCSNGYAPSGVANGVCSAQTGPNSAWTGQLITCTAVSCAPATAPLNGNVGTCGTGSLGGTCNLACNDGYSASGSTGGICTAGSGATASWQGQALTCTMVPCAAVSVVPSNALKGTCLGGGALGSSCALNCSNGYAPSGVATGVCTALTGPNSAWVGQNVTCTAVPCLEASPLPPNATLNNCVSAVIGTTCHLSCANGFVSSNRTQGTCTAGSGGTASWVGQNVICTPANCTPLTGLSTGYGAGTCLNAPMYSTCQMNCTDGYLATGTLVGTCIPGNGAFSQWVGQGIGCGPVPCGAATPPANANIGNCTAFSPQGSICYLACNNGYAASGIVVGTCVGGTGATANWANLAITCTPVSCSAVSAGSLPAHATGGNCTSTGALFTACVLSCADGYAASGAVSGTCAPLPGPNAAWTGQNITCSPVSCAAASAPLNGNANDCTARVLGSTCTLACNNGYIPSASTSGTCTPGTGPTASWQGQGLTCTAATCGAATISAPFTIGNCTAGGVLHSLCMWGCIDGYLFSNPTYGVCTEASGPNALWQNMGGACNAVSCGASTAPLHGSRGTCVSGGALYANCTQTCDDGYAPSGSAIGQCTPQTGPNASWTGLSLTCSAVTCPAATPLPAFSLINTCTGGAALTATCALTCQNGYAPSGVADGTCSPTTGPNAAWTGQTITCTAVPCSALVFGAGSVNAGTCLSGALGATCSLACNDGYAPSGSNQGTCTGAGATSSWVGQSITCNAVSCPATTPSGTGVNVGSCTAGGALGTNCNLACNDGYNPTSGVPGTCSPTSGPNASWQGQALTCTAVNCAAVTSFPSHATVGTCTSQVLGSTCALGCADGYSSGSIVTGHCVAGTGPTASWASQSIVCSPVSCTAPSLPSRAVLGNCTTQLLGTTCVLGCQDGYSASGIAVGTCTAGTGATAAWAGQAITCTGVDCPAVTSFPGHANVGTCTSGALGSTCSLACDNGYSVTSSTPGTCVSGSGATSSWVNQTIVCTAVTCPAPSSLPSHSIANTCVSGAALSATCTLGCADGYSVVIGSSSTGTCTPTTGPNAAWQGQAITCSPVSCPTLGGLPSHVNAGTCTVQTLGSACALACDNGYGATGSATGTCTATSGPNAAWQGQAVTCTAVTCPAASVSGGVALGNCTAGGVQSMTCRLACADGYAATNIVTGTCSPTSGANAAWTSQSITCTAVFCAAVTSGLPTGANTGTCTSRALGNSCNLDCNNGYSIGLSPPGVCTAGTGPIASWVGQSIVCNPVSCSATSSLPAHATTGTCTTGALNAPCQLGCIDGYSVNSVVSGTCTPLIGANAAWLGQNVTCSPVFCPALTSFSGHNVIGSCTSKVLSSSCQLGCDNGYTPGSVVPGTCTAGTGATASWQGQSTTCSPASCSATGTLSQFATVGTCTSGTLGDSCALACADGYNRTSFVAGTCTAGVGATASWTGQSAVCSPVSCPAVTGLPTHVNAGTCTSQVLNSNCQLGCDNGYTPSQSVPGACCAGTGAVAMWQHHSILCSPASCSPPTLATGTALGSCGTATLGATCTLACATGWTVNAAIPATPGECVSSAGATAVWSGQTIACTAVNCTAPTLGNMPHAAVGTCANGNLGAKCRLSCANGYTTTSSTEGTCMSSLTGNSWSGLSVNCTAVNCPAVSTTTLPAHATVGTCLASPVGSLCALGCEVGYNSSGTATTGACIAGQGATAFWQGQSVYCPPVNCSDPGVPLNGSRSTPLGFYYGQHVTFACDNGMVLTGMDTITCQADGKWSSATPLCTDAAALGTGIAPPAATNTVTAEHSYGFLVGLAIALGLAWLALVVIVFAGATYRHHRHSRPSTVALAPIKDPLDGTNGTLNASNLSMAFSRTTLANSPSQVLSPIRDPLATDRTLNMSVVSITEAEAAAALDFGGGAGPEFDDDERAPAAFEAEEGAGAGRHEDEEGSYESYSGDEAGADGEPQLDANGDPIAVRRYRWKPKASEIVEEKEKSYRDRIKPEPWMISVRQGLKPGLRENSPLRQNANAGKRRKKAVLPHQSTAASPLVVSLPAPPTELSRAAALREAARITRPGLTGAPPPPSVVAALPPISSLPPPVPAALPPSIKNLPTLPPLSPNGGSPPSSDGSSSGGSPQVAKPAPAVLPPVPVAAPRAGGLPAPPGISLPGLPVIKR